MPLELKEIRNGFVAELDGVDLRGALNPWVASQLRKAAKKYAVMIIRNQDVDYEKFVQFANVFGKPSRCQDITNLNEDGTIRPPVSLEARQTRGNALYY